MRTFLVIFIIVTGLILVGMVGGFIEGGRQERTPSISDYDWHQYEEWEMHRDSDTIYFPHN